MKKMLKKIGEKLKPFKKPTRNVLAATLALHVATQALYTGKGVGERINPTPLQEQLKRGYDLTLRGDPSERVDNP